LRNIIFIVFLEDLINKFERVAGVRAKKNYSIAKVPNF